MKSDYSNVILLSVDALRKDRVNGRYDRDTTPFLSKLGRENTEFTNCISTSSHTREAMSSMLTGVYPYRANKSGLIPKKAPGGGFHLDQKTISSYLDIKTGGFHSNPFLSRSFGYGEYWSRFDDDLYLGKNKILTLLNRFVEKLTNRHYSDAEHINRKSLDWINSIENNEFFLWNHYMDPHGPYQPPKEFKGIYQENPLSDRKAQKLLNKAINSPKNISVQEKQNLKDLYDEECRYVDSKIKEFFNNLEEQNKLDESLIIIVGDHGEAFGENGFYEHGGALTEGLVRVPLIIVNGDNRAVDTPTSVIDIVPTILAALGKEIPDNLDGENLLDISDNPKEFRDRTVFCQETKNENLLFGGFKGKEVFVLEAENQDVESKNSDGIEQEVRSYSKKVLGKENQEEEEDVEEEVKDRLEALGYMGDKSR